MPRTRRLRSSNISEDAIQSLQLDSDDEPILKSQREKRTTSSTNKNLNTSTPSNVNLNKRITRQTVITEFLKSQKNEESSDTSDSNSVDNSKASKSMGMKCPRPDLKPIKSVSRKENLKKCITNRRETRQSAANSVKKCQKILRLSSGESDSEYESFNSTSSDVDDIVSKEGEYHSSYSDADDESATDETELNLSDSVDGNTNYISSDETQPLDENTKDNDESESVLDDSQKETNNVEKIKEPKSTKKKSKIKNEVHKKVLTEEEEKEREERLKRIEETVNRVLNNPDITLSEESMKPRPRYSKQHAQSKSVNETVQMVIDEVTDKALNNVSQTPKQKVNQKSVQEPTSSVTTLLKKKKVNKNAIKEIENVPSTAEKMEIDKPEKSNDEAPDTTPVIKPAKVIGRRGRPPGSPNKKKKAPELQKFLQMDYSKITERPGITEPIIEEANPDRDELVNSLIQFRKLLKSGMLNKYSIRRFSELHESLCHIAREVTHEHDSLLRLVPNNKCRANDKPKVKKRLLRAVGDKVSDKFVRKALKGEDDYVLNDVWISTDNPDERSLYPKITSEGVICQFHQEIKELLAAPSLPKLIEAFKTFRLNDETSQKICEFDYPTTKFEQPTSLGKRVIKNVKNQILDVPKDPVIPIPTTTEKSPRKILEPTRKSTRRKARGGTPDKSMEKRITRSQNNAVKVPAYNEIKRKRRKNNKRGVFIKNGKGRFQRFLTKRRFFKKMDIYSPNFVDNYRETHFESIIHVVLNYFASNDIIVDFRQRNFWDFLLSDSKQLNSLFNNRIQYVKNNTKDECNEKYFEKMEDLLKSIKLSITGATHERNKRIGSDGILRNGIFKSDVILEYQSIYESFASKVAINEYGWEIFHFHKPKSKNKGSKKNEIVECFTTSIPEKMLINRLLLARNLTNVEKWNKYVDYCKDRKLHQFFEERTDLWNKNDIFSKFDEESLKGKTLASIKKDEKSLNLKEMDEYRKLKDLIWERDYMASSDPVTRKLFILKKELHELMYERNKTLDHIFESSIAFIVRDILDKKMSESEEKLKKKFDETKIEKEEDLDQIPLNRVFMEENKSDLEVVKNLGKLFNFLGTIEEDNQCDYDCQKVKKYGNNGGSSNGLTKKLQVKYKCIIKNNDVILKKYVKRNCSTNESSVDETPELSSDKNKFAKDSQNPLKRKRELKDSSTSLEYCSSKKRQSGMWKQLESLNKEKNTYFWRTSFVIPNVNNRLTRGGLKNLENSAIRNDNTLEKSQSPLFLPEDTAKNTISTENDKSTMSPNNNPIWHQLQKVTNSQGSDKLKNSDRDNKIGVSTRKRKCMP